MPIVLVENGRHIGVVAESDVGVLDGQVGGLGVTHIRSQTESIRQDRESQFGSQPHQVIVDALVPNTQRNPWGQLLHDFARLLKVTTYSVSPASNDAGANDPMVFGL
jgi:hypothetical protein